MKNKFLGLFLILGLLVIPVFSMELEGQDYTGDFLIEEMNEQYPEDTEYFAEKDDYVPVEAKEEKPQTWFGASDKYSSEKINEDKKNIHLKDKENKNQKKMNTENKEIFE